MDFCNFRNLFSATFTNPVIVGGVFNPIIREKSLPGSPPCLVLVQTRRCRSSPARFLQERTSWSLESFTTYSRLCSMSLALEIELHRLQNGDEAATNFPRCPAFPSPPYFSPEPMLQQTDCHVRIHCPRPGVLSLAPPPPLVIEFDSSPSTALPAWSPHCVRLTPSTCRGLAPLVYWFFKNIRKTASLSLRC